MHNIGLTLWITSFYFYFIFVVYVKHVAVSQYKDLSNHYQKTIRCNVCIVHKGAAEYLIFHEQPPHRKFLHLQKTVLHDLLYPIY